MRHLSRVFRRLSLAFLFLAVVAGLASYRYSKELNVTDTLTAAGMEAPENTSRVYPPIPEAGNSFTFMDVDQETGFLFLLLSMLIFLGLSVYFLIKSNRKPDPHHRIKTE